MIFQMHLAVSNSVSVWSSHLLLPFEEFFGKNCMSVSLLLIPLLQEELIVNHSLLCSISAPYIRCFSYTTSDILCLISYSSHNCNDSFCEDAVHLYAGTIWQCPSSGECSLPLIPHPHGFCTWWWGSMGHHWDFVQHSTCEMQKWQGLNTLGVCMGGGGVPLTNEEQSKG